MIKPKRKIDALVTLNSERKKIYDSAWRDGFSDGLLFFTIATTFLLLILSVVFNHD